MPTPKTVMSRSDPSRLLKTNMAIIKASWAVEEYDNLANSFKNIRDVFEIHGRGNNQKYSNEIQDSVARYSAQALVWMAKAYFESANHENSLELITAFHEENPGHKDSDYMDLLAARNYMSLGREDDAVRVSKDIENINYKNSAQDIIGGEQGGV